MEVNYRFFAISGLVAAALAGCGGSGGGEGETGASGDTDRTPSGETSPVLDTPARITLSNAPSIAETARASLEKAIFDNRQLAGGAVTAQEALFCESGSGDVTSNEDGSVQTTVYDDCRIGQTTFNGKTTTTFSDSRFVTTIVYEAFSFRFEDGFNAFFDGEFNMVLGESGQLRSQSYDGTFEWRQGDEVLWNLTDARFECPESAEGEDLLGGCTVSGEFVDENNRRIRSTVLSLEGDDASGWATDQTVCDSENGCFDLATEQPVTFCPDGAPQSGTFRVSSETGDEALIECISCTTFVVTQDGVAESFTWSD